MAISIRVDNEIYHAAKSVAKGECRSIASQIGFWAKIGKAALDNPDLPIDFIKDLLISKNQDRSMAELFNPEVE